MTGYRRTTVSGPKKAFDRLREEFYVEEDRGDELVLITEEHDHFLDDPVRGLVEEEFGLMGFSSFGKPVSFQKDLPEELRDVDEVAEEEERATPA